MQVYNDTTDTMYTLTSERPTDAVRKKTHIETNLAVYRRDPFEMKYSFSHI